MKRLMQIVIIVAVIMAGCVFVNAETEGDYEYKIKDDGAIITAASEALSGEVSIPDELGGCPVVKIGEFAFENNMNITKVILPDTVKVIAAYGFFHCENLTEAILNEGLEEIGHYSFSSTKLEKIDIPESVTFIGMFAFSGSEAEEIRLGKNVSEITAGAFSYMDKLVRITVDEENESFSSFGGVLFTKDRKELILFPPARGGEYSIPEGVEKLYGSAFETSSVTSLILPESLVSVGDQCFVNSKMEVLYINSYVKNIRYANLEYCDNLKNIYYNNSEDEWKKMNLTSYNLPKGVKVSYNVDAEENAEVVFADEAAFIKVESNSAEGIVICAMYKDGCLVAVNSKTCDGNTKEFEIKENDFDNIKVFVFESFEGLTPYKEAEAL